MKIDRVTITGADDRTPHDELVRLSGKYPFVEWAILFSKSKVGTARYPTPDWTNQMEDLAVDHQMRLAAHLCGEYARQTILDGIEHVGVPYKRVQLNGWSKYRLEARHANANGKLSGLMMATPSLAYIFQIQNDEAYNEAKLNALFHKNVSVVFDASGGHGVAPATWTVPDFDFYTGFAGGIGPDNARSTIEQLLAMRGRVVDELTCWIDMESRVRTDDEFDLAKVEQVLSSVADLIV